MSQQSADTFAQKLFTDDAFIGQVVRHGGLTSSGPKEEKNALLIKAAGELGYDFTEEEYNEANRKYFAGGGFFKVIKTLMRVNRATKAAEREMKG